MLAEFVQSGAISFFEIHMLNRLTVHPIFHKFSPQVSPRFFGGSRGGPPGLTVLVRCRSFLEGSFFLVGVGEIMVENWYEYYFRLRCYVSSWGVNTWKVLSFWWGLEKSW